MVPGSEPHHSPVSSHTVAMVHREELEGFTTRIYNYVLGLCLGEREGAGSKKEEDWQQMLAQGQSFPEKIKKNARGNTTGIY